MLLRQMFFHPEGASVIKVEVVITFHGGKRFYILSTLQCVYLSVSHSFISHFIGTYPTNHF